MLLGLCYVFSAVAKHDSLNLGYYFSFCLFIVIKIVISLGILVYNFC